MSCPDSRFKRPTKGTLRGKDLGGSRSAPLAVRRRPRHTQAGHAWLVLRITIKSPSAQYPETYTATICFSRGGGIPLPVGGARKLTFGGRASLVLTPTRYASHRMKGLELPPLTKGMAGGWMIASAGNLSCHEGGGGDNRSRSSVVTCMALPPCL